MKELNNKPKKTTITIDVALANRIRVNTVNSEFATIGEYIKSVLDKVEGK